MRSQDVIPDCAEFILGHAEGVTRGLHPGYGAREFSSATGSGADTRPICL